MSAPPPGIYVPAVLFFHEDESLDFESIKLHVLRLALGGITGILVQGSNGEAQHLSQSERKQTIQFTRTTLNANGFSHVLVIAGTGAQSTKETKALCVDAAEAGASHALVLTPSTWVKMMTRERILKFHRDVADASPIPTMIYNFPGVTAGIDLDSSILIELAYHPNIVGTKLSCGNIGKLQRITSTVPSSTFAVFAGRSDVLLQGLISGSAGGITALVNVSPAAHVKVFARWKEGKGLEEMELQALLGRADAAVSAIGGISGIKAIIQENFGYGEPRAREPLGPANVKTLTGPNYDTVLKLLEVEKSLA